MPSIKGIWRWKDAIDFSSVSGYITQDVNFTSNGESFRAIEIRPTLLFYYSSVSSGSEQIAVGDGTGVQDAYKQIDFGDTAQTVSDEFYAVFSANADSTEFIIQMGAVYPVKLLTKGCYLDKNIRILPPPIDEPIFEERTVTPTAQTQEVTPGVGYDALSKVIVNAVPTETKSVTPTEQEQIIRGSEGSFLSSVSVKAIQASEKTVTENGEYTPTSGTYYKKVTVNVPQYTDVSATTAQADDVLQGKSFYPYNGSPLTEGTIPVQTPSNPEFTRKTDTATFPKGYYSSESTVKIADTEQAKIIPENIKKDTVILGVTGSYAGTDVSDTTATQGDVLSGKYFYGSDGVKTEGTIPVHTETSIILNAGTGDQYVPAGHYSDILTKLVLNSDAASKIKQGEVILGVTGSYAGSGSAIEVATEAEMANILSSATADDNGKIYRYIGTTGTYVNGALYWLEVPVEPIEPTTDELAGTWVFNDTVDISTAFNYSLNFVAKYNDNDTNFVSISATTSGFAKGIAYTAEDANIGTIIVYRASGWDYEAYKTIAITSKLSEVSNGDTLLAWLQANATKQ